MVNVQQIIDERLAQAGDMVKTLGAIRNDVGRLIDLVRRCLADGGTVFTCGNGGSAAEAMHLAEELIGRYRSNRKPLRAICLNSDPTAITCIANDFGFEDVFSRPLGALGRSGDLLIAFSTSGNSPNILSALRTARVMQMRTAALLGGTGGGAMSLCDCPVVVSCGDAAAVQEGHQMIMHMICEALEGPLESRS